MPASPAEAVADARSVSEPGSPLRWPSVRFSALKLANLNSAVTSKVFQTVFAVCLCLWHLHHSAITCTCVSLVCFLRADCVSCLIFEF